MKIKGFDDVYHIDEFELRKERGRHSYCHFSASVAEKMANKYVTMAGMVVSVQLDNGMVVFNGIVQEISVKKTYSSTALNVTLASLSVCLDQEKKSRIFQDPQKNFGELLSAQRLALPSCELRLLDNLQSAVYEPVVVQAEETDFAFIQRMAAYSQKNLWVGDVFENKVVIAIGDANINKQEIVIGTDEIIASAYTQHWAGKKKWYSQKIKLKKYIELGRIIKLGKSNTPYIVTAVNIRKVHESDEFIYEIEEWKRAETTRRDNEAFREETVKLKGQVTNVQDPEQKGRIQVAFIDDNIEDMDQEEEKRAWFNYGTPYSGKKGGIVFLPDVGDIVEVFFKNGKYFACSALRQRALAEECCKVEEKYIGNNTQQRIFWKDNSLELYSFENKIYMDENKIEVCVGDNQICVDKDKILLKTADNELVLQKGGILLRADQAVEQQAKAVQVKGKSKVHIESGGSATVKSSSSLNLQGRTVHIS